ncbi:multidrug ABC transporter ATP-binding protein [Ornatilinea apprima]|uniref:Multidrug ABC transporter ATP-binding protein n=1 Tax=Ornatilinea apprima TaxID=1134406 RepID=A0A0P6Y2H5_9CHLR|nr:ABC transporter ATP-binding protein [Ornatilinea apprima]KPL79133.1 multidrug ABC transporter ATP-binding protein [Ornatilinea apprima]
MSELLKLGTFGKKYWKSAVLSLALMSLGVGADLAIPALLRRLVDQGITQKDMSAVITTALIMLSATIVSTFFALGNNLHSILFSEGFARDLRSALFDKIQTLSFGNLDRLRTGQLIVRLTSDVHLVQLIWQMSLRIGARAPLLLIGSLVLMFITSPRMALRIIPLMLALVALIVIFSPTLQKLFRSVQQKLDALNNVLQENLAGIRVVKAFVRSRYENQRFDVVNQDLTQKNISVQRWMAVLMPTLMNFVNMGIVAVIWFGGIDVINDQLTVGQLMAFTNYLLSALFPVLIASMLVGSIAAAEASAGRINEVLESQPEIQNQPDAVEAHSLRGEVEFENVTFQYNGNEADPVLRGINLKVQPGETIAILGSTGSGKSTLVNLIPRFYEASQGRVLIDGRDVRDFTHESLLTHFGIALQETVLFSGTIRDNIRYGKPQASDEDVIAAAKAAQAHEFIESLPNGYDTPVEQRGTNLSGGQKQRIAIARALLVKPRILILDDSTSAVDVDTEAHIQDALQDLMRGRTSFVIAQRISTVLSADRIIVMDNGQIAAIGSHAELIQTSPIYREIYDSQLGNGGKNS